MTSPIGIPTTADEITALWLTNALRSSGMLERDTVIASLTVEPMDGAGLMGQMARLKPVCDPPAQHMPRTLVAKFSHAEYEKRMSALHVYVREVTIYQKLADQIPLTLPNCYYSDINRETAQSIILLADLGHLRKQSIAEGCSVADAKLVVSQLALFHAAWWENPQLETFDYLGRIIAELNEENIAWYHGIWDQFEEKISEASPDSYIPQTFLEIGDRYAKQRSQIINKVLEAPLTIVHNDIHLDNLMFAAKEADPPLTVLDWQTCSIGPGAADITRFIMWALPVKERRLAEADLLQTYHTILVEQGVCDYSLEQCWRDYRLSFFRNLAIGVWLTSYADWSTPYMQEILQIFIPRLASFAEDHRVDEFLS